MRETKSARLTRMHDEYDILRQLPRVLNAGVDVNFYLSLIHI